jgi:hypothetical protein
MMWVTKLKNFTQGITVINKLIEFDPNYKEDFSLYMATNQFDKALALIQELNETSGKQIVENYTKVRFYL